MLLNTAIQQLNGFEKYSIAISLMLNHNLTGLFMYYSLEQKSGTLLYTRAFVANSQPHTMHISWYEKGIPRMWTDFGKTSLYRI